VEPVLREGLAGGLRVESDAVVYAPVIAHAISMQLARRRAAACIWAGACCNPARAQ